MMVTRLAAIAVLILLGCHSKRMDEPTYTISRNVELALNAADFLGEENLGGTMRWSVLDAPSSLPAGQFTQPAMQHTGFTGTSTGRYRLALTYISGGSEAQYEITVRVINDAPTVEAPADRIVQVGRPARLSIASSGDLNGDLLSFEWLIQEVPDESQLQGTAVVAQESMGMEPEFVPDALGAYQIVLTARDGEGASSSDRFGITAVSMFQPWLANATKISRLGNVLLTVAPDRISLAEGDGQPLEITFQAPVWSAKLFALGSLAMVIEGGRLHVIDTALGQIVQTISIGESGALIDLRADDTVFIERPGEILAVDLASGEMTSFSMVTLRTNTFYWDSPITYDRVQEAFYSRRRVYVTVDETHVEKWRLGQGEMVELNQVIHPFTGPLTLHLSVERQQLVSLEGGQVYSIGTDPQEDLVLVGTLESERGQFHRLLRPAGEDWSVALEKTFTGACCELVVYSDGSYERSEQPLAQQVPGVTVPRHLDMALSTHPNEVLLLSTSPGGTGTILISVPLEID